LRPYSSNLVVDDFGFDSDYGSDYGSAVGSAASGCASMSFALVAQILLVRQKPAFDSSGSVLTQALVVHRSCPT